MRRTLLGLYTYVEFFVLALVYLPVMAVAVLFAKADPGQRVRGQWMRRFGRLTSALTPLWRFNVEGEGPPDILKKPYVVVANHQSTADPFLLSWLPWDMRWVAKEELFKQPVTGWLLKLGGDIALRRGERSSIQDMFRECHKTLQANVPVMLFPEGTRSPDGEVKAFKDGAFELAIEAQVPVLPVVVHGTRACRPKGSRWFGDADAVAKVLEPVPTEGLTVDDVPKLREQVRTRIIEALKELEARTSSAPMHTPRALPHPH